jgi:hypothetical protein
MITDADIKKMKRVFTTKEDLKSFATKVELKTEVGILNKKIDSLDRKSDITVQEVLNFIVETKNDILKELHDFRNEFNEFRNEMRDINRNSQSTLNNHEVRIAHLEYKHNPA